MPSTTANLALPYPVGGDPNNYPGDMQTLATALDTDLTAHGAALPSAGSSHMGQRFRLLDGGGNLIGDYLFDGTAWNPAGNGDQRLRAYSETVVVNAAVTGATNIDVSLASVYDITLTGNATLAFTNPVATGRVGSLTLLVRQDGTGSRLITWPAAVKWPGGTAPTLSTGAGKVDTLSFMTRDGGTTWYNVGGLFDLR